MNFINHQIDDRAISKREIDRTRSRNFRRLVYDNNKKLAKRGHAYRRLTTPKGSDWDDCWRTTSTIIYT